MGDGAFTRCLHETLLKLDLGATLDETFSTLAQPATANSQYLAEVLRGNQAYEHLLRRSDLLKKRKSSLFDEEDADSADAAQATLRIVGLLGKQGTRNALISLRLNRVLGTGIPDREDQAFTLDPQATLKRALEAEEFTLEKRMAHSEMSFVGGLLYDWLTALATQNKGIPKTASSYLDELWAQSHRTAQLVYHIGAVLKSFKYQQFAFAAGLTLSLGRYMMVVLFSSTKSWADFLEEMKEENLDEFHPLFIARERKTFSMTHAELSALLASFYSPLKPIEKALCYYQEPVMLATAHPDLYRLSVILSIAHRLSSLGHEKCKIANSSAELLTRSQLRWAKEIGITDSILLTAIKQTQELGT